MTPSPKTNRLIWFLLIIAYFTGGYLAINWINANRLHYYHIELPLEAKIPFIPIFILGYSLVYLSVLLLYFILSDYNYYVRAIQAFFLLTTIHLVFFILIPVQMTMRPDLSGNSTLFGWLTDLYYWIDAPQNCFPSLHVAYTFLGTCIVWNYRKGWRIPYLIATIIVSLSVLLVKQHYLLDIVGGLMTAPLVWWIVQPRTRSQTG